jgi:hypothetical protein
VRGTSLYELYKLYELNKPDLSPLYLYCISIVSLTVSSFYELYKLYELNKPDLSLAYLLFLLSPPAGES